MREAAAKDPLPLGLVLGSALPPERLPVVARLAEEACLSEIWVSEHLYYSGAMTSVAAVLAATRSIPVGPGVVSAVTRVPAVLALELATLARLHPGRLMAGIGLGDRSRLRELGIAPQSPVTAVQDCLRCVRRLLKGEADGPLRLEFPPPHRVPLYLGATKRRLLELSGACADGTLLSWIKTPEYVSWARERIAAGAAVAGRRTHRIVSFAAFSVDSDAAAARASLRQAVAVELASGPSVFTKGSEIGSELIELATRTPEGLTPQTLEKSMPDRWLDSLTVSGTPADCVHALRTQLDAGADCVALLPYPPERAQLMLELAVSRILPELAREREKKRHP